MKKLFLLALLSAAPIFAMDREEKRAEDDYADMPELEAIDPTEFWKDVIGEHETVTEVKRNKTGNKTLVFTRDEQDDSKNVYVYATRGGAFLQTVQSYPENSGKVEDLLNNNDDLSGAPLPEHIHHNDNGTFSYQNTAKFTEHFSMPGNNDLVYVSIFCKKSRRDSGRLQIRSLNIQTGKEDILHERDAFCARLNFSLSPDKTTIAIREYTIYGKSSHTNNEVSIFVKDLMTGQTIFSAERQPWSSRKETDNGLEMSDPRLEDVISVCYDDNNTITVMTKSKQTEKTDQFSYKIRN